MAGDPWREGERARVAGRRLKGSYGLVVTRGVLWRVNCLTRMNSQKTHSTVTRAPGTIQEQMGKNSADGLVAAKGRSSPAKWALAKLSWNILECPLSHPRRVLMIAIRIPKAQRAKAWRAMIEVAPVRLVSKGPVYEVCPAHLELLTARGISYAVVKRPPAPPEKGRHAASH